MDQQRAIQSLLEYASKIQEVAPDPILLAIQKLDDTVKNKTDDDTAVIKAIAALIPALKAIPAAIKMPITPEPLESVSVTNLGEVTKPLADAIKLLQQTVKELKLDNKIDIPAPNVKVDAPNLSPLLTATDRVEQAIKAIKFPTIPEPKAIDLSAVTKAANATTQAINDLTFPVAGATPTDPFVRYLPADIDDAGAVQYFGYTDVQGHWYIQKFDTSTSPKTIRFTAGNTGYSAAFTGRVGLTYTVWST